MLLVASMAYRVECCRGAAFPGAEALRPLGVSGTRGLQRWQRCDNVADSRERSKSSKPALAELSAASRKSLALLVCYKPLAAVLAAFAVSWTRVVLDELTHQQL